MPVQSDMMSWDNVQDYYSTSDPADPDRSKVFLSSVPESSADKWRSTG